MFIRKRVKTTNSFKETCKSCCFVEHPDTGLGCKATVMEPCADVDKKGRPLRFIFIYKEEKK